MEFLLTKPHTTLSPRIKGLWILELRSGKVQGHPYLHWDMGLEPSYSVLGILLKLAQEEGIRVQRLCKNQIVLPQEVLDWSGLGNRTGELPDGRTLLELNEEYSFLELADIIEEYL